MSDSDFEPVEGSGNVFRDLGDPDADLKQAKAILAARIVAALEDRGLSVRKAGALTGFAAADFSRIRNADLGRFTLDRLMKMLAALDGDLRISLRVEERREGEAAAHSGRRSRVESTFPLPPPRLRVTAWPRSTIRTRPARR